MDFRRSRPEDARGIEMLEEKIFPDPWSYRDVVDLISTEGAMCYVAERDGRLAAYVLGRVIAPEGEIYRIATIPEFRERGIAYRLLSYAHKTELGHGLETLFLEVRSKNTAALALYRSFGFVNMGVRKNYYKDPVDDAVIMIKASPADMP